MEEKELQQEPVIDNVEQEQQDEEVIPVHRVRRHVKPVEEGQHNLIFKIRQVLNLLFIIFALVGAGVHTYGKWYAGVTRIEIMGIVIVVIAMAIKMAECVLRYKK